MTNVAVRAITAPYERNETESSLRTDARSHFRACMPTPELIVVNIAAAIWFDSPHLKEMV